MNKQDQQLPLPEYLSDEAAYALCEVLMELALACESRYFDQLRRYRENHPPGLFDPERPWWKPPAK